jgi:succinate dehydrogenase / fumarate reductase flavoprotein subunit
MHLDPRKEPIPVSPGIHYFMGGMHVDERHATILPGLYAAGE